MYRSVVWAEGSYSAVVSGLLSLPLPRPDSPEHLLLPAADRAVVCHFSIPNTGYVAEAEERNLPEDDVDQMQTDHEDEEKNGHGLAGGTRNCISAPN